MNDIKGKISASARIYRNVKIGAGVTIGENAIVYDNVEVGGNSFIGPHCILGEPLAAFYRESDYKNPPLIIGRNSIVRSGTVIYAGSVFGEGFETGHRATIREYSEFGVQCSVGTLSDIQGFVKVGNYCRFHSNVHIGQRSVIKDYVWIFPYVVLTNDPHPPSECLQGPTIEEYAVIAVGAIIMPSVTVGREAVVAAGALVNKDVLPEMVVAGVPAKELCPTRDIRCKEGILDQPYPWKAHFSRGFPWGGK